MNKKWSWFLLTIFIPAGFLPIVWNKKETAMSQAKSAGFALIELFTSEGCSSCPPADALMAELQEQYRNSKFLVLEYHVDYWDYLGWKDPFSRKEFTDRQKNYSELFKLNSIYTPQAVINGSAEYVGSDRRPIENRIRDCIAGEASKISRMDARLTGQNKIEVKYQPDPSNTVEHETIFLLVKKSATNRVIRGENAGNALRHINIVRDMHTWNSSQLNEDIIFHLPADSPKEDYFITLIRQNKITGSIISFDSTLIH